jgi:hypothetical protein
MARSPHGGIAVFKAPQSTLLFCGASLALCACGELPE